MEPMIEVRVVCDAAAAAQALDADPRAWSFPVDEPLRMHVRRKYALTDAEMDESTDYLDFLFQKETTQPDEWWVEYVAWVRRLCASRGGVVVSIVSAHTAPGFLNWLREYAPDVTVVDLRPAEEGENV